VQWYVDSGEEMVEEASMLTQFGICDQTTGLGDVTRELKFRLKSFTERLEKTRALLDLSQRCYQLLDKVLSYECVV